MPHEKRVSECAQCIISNHIGYVKLRSLFYHTYDDYPVVQRSIPCKMSSGSQGDGSGTRITHPLALRAHPRSQLPSEGKRVYLIGAEALKPPHESCHGPKHAQPFEVQLKRNTLWPKQRPCRIHEATKIMLKKIYTCKGRTGMISGRQCINGCVNNP